MFLSAASRSPSDAVAPQRRATADRRADPPRRSRRRALVAALLCAGLAASADLRPTCWPTACRTALGQNRPAASPARPGRLAPLSSEDVVALATVDDGTPAWRAEEQAAWERLLADVKQKPEAEARDEASRFQTARRVARRALFGEAVRFDPLEDLTLEPAESRGRWFLLPGRIVEDVAWPPLPLPEPVGALRLLKLETDEQPPRTVRIAIPAAPAQNDGAARRLGPAIVTARFLKLLPDTDAMNPAVPDAKQTIPLFVAGSATPFGHELPEEVLSAVEQRTLGILPTEREAYLAALTQARLTPTADVRKGAREFRDERIRETKFPRKAEDFPTFVDLFKNPDRYHGRPVTLTGHVRRLVDTQAGDNAYELGTLYEVWLYTFDSQTNPALFVCTQIPEGVVPGGALESPLEVVTVSGYFFKLAGYDAQDTKRLVPMLVAREMIWQPIPPPAPVPTWLKVLFSVAGFGGLALVIVLVVRSMRRDRSLSRRLREQESPGPVLPDPRALGEVDTGGGPDLARLREMDHGTEKRFSSHPRDESPAPDRRDAGNAPPE